MKLFSKILILLLVFCLILTGCNTNLSEQETTEANVESQTPFDDHTKSNGEATSDELPSEENSSAEDETTIANENTTDVDNTTSDDESNTEDESESTSEETTSTGDNETTEDEEGTTEEASTEEATTDEEQTTVDPESIIEENPKPDSEISIKTAIALGLTYESNKFSTDKFYVRGKVTNIEDGSKVNITIKNKYGDELYLYTVYGKNGDSYSSMTTKPQIGDTILVYGIIGQFRSTPEMKNGWIVEIEGDTGDLPNPNDPYANVTAEEFYANYKPATSWEDAYWRSRHYFMSGEIADQYQAPTFSQYRPEHNGILKKNYSMIYSDDGNTYTVLDSNGQVAFKIYRGGAYIMLEEVAAYVFAFGDIPANYNPNKNASPSSSPWGKYLRVNKTNFSGNVSSYPYEPELPDITGCGGKTYYYEIDIGTMGTDCDPSYPIKVYNDGRSITRGAARIVFGRRDLNGNGTYEAGEIYVFYTYNHYNDFQEYLNYEGGWGEMFGNITGGGSLSSKSDYNPTEYVHVLGESFAKATPAYRKVSVYYIDTRTLYYATRMCA